MLSLPLQTTTGTPAIVLLLSISLLVAVVFSLVIGVKGVRNYRASGDRGIALLTVGILLLSGVAVGINVALRLCTDVPGWVVPTAGNLVRLLGIGIIIVAIYDQ